MSFPDLTTYQSDVLLKLVNLAEDRGLTHSEFDVLCTLDRVKIRAPSLEEFLVLEKEARGALKVLADRGYVDVTREWEHGFKFVFSPQALNYYEWVHKPVLSKRLRIWWNMLPTEQQIAVVGVIISVIIPTIAAIFYLWQWLR